MSKLSEKLSGWKHFYSGKVRDLYESEDSSQSDLVLIVASDRISAFDNILSPAIPGKGENLTSITNFWFEKLSVPNHRVQSVSAPSEVKERATVAKKLEMYPVECVVRGYIAGSGYKEYLATGEICGIKLPQGLKDGDKLPEPIFTPAFKAEVGEHDQNIDFEKVIELVGEEIAQKLRATSIEIFNQASAIALQAGLVLADTKFEFGKDPKGEAIVLADEVLTPDSSRYWDRAAYELGSTVESFDKQIVRNWLLQSWDPEGSNPPTILSPELVEKVSSRYAELRKKLTDTNQ
ncbi:MAG: phosphoribosylaminoimidazolesuccinocarboxamide synthase [Actinobacteria bacterium]|nr:phosphoribosylaminoimidazolesuccinocarboxamide synthase [Actinomycetota bacterium]